MKIVTEIKLLNGLNPGEVFLQVTYQEIFFDDAGLLIKTGSPYSENQLLYPTPYHAWQVGNAS